MLFNSLEFVLFLPLVFLAYWFVFNRKLGVQNLFIVFISCVFYGWWDWRFLVLIFFNTIVAYVIGLLIKKSESEKRRYSLLILSLTLNLTLLGFFKYFNFFIESYADALRLFGFSPNVTSLQIILPVGISFYTFQTLSYTVDVYRNTLEPTRNFIKLFAFVSYFPQLVAGPIERATNLLPQFDKPRKFDYESARDGMRQILWGFFKKIVIADNCAVQVEKIFSDYHSQPASILIVGAIYFSFQIYCDFSGYTDIARGVARLMGFSLMQNFKTPFLSKSITEFWRRWHISLSTWFNDYIYMPFLMRRRDWGQKGIVIGLFLTFTLSGLWHGAGWTFIIYGMLHGAVIVYEFLTKKARKKIAKLFPEPVYNLLCVVLTFSFFTFSLIFFRSKSVVDALNYIDHIFSSSLFVFPRSVGVTMILPLILIVFIVEYVNREKQHGLFLPAYWKSYFTWPIYYAIIFVLFFFGAKQQGFIYFQF